jgi:hypothetical protein
MMPDWEQPELGEWVSALSTAVASVSEPPLIVAHSLGCLAVAHWARSGGRARGALLVAVPDPEGPAFPEVALSFAPAPREPIAFPTVLVASHDDPYASFAFAERCANAWHSTLRDIGRAGHINAESGLGDWPEGRALLRSLLV